MAGKARGFFRPFPLSLAFLVAVVAVVQHKVQSNSEYYMQVSVCTLSSLGSYRYGDE